MDPLLETGGRYEKLENLGAGSFGFVVLAQNKLGKKAAIKVICMLRTKRATLPCFDVRVATIQLLKRGSMNKYVEAEILNHSKLRHPHVIQFKAGDKGSSICHKCAHASPYVMIACIKDISAALHGCVALVPWCGLSHGVWMDHGYNSYKTVAGSVVEPRVDP